MVEFIYVCAPVFRLEEAGYGVGQRVLELVAVREKYNRRETRVVQILQYISNNIWRYLFGKNADSLERSMENEDECKSVVATSIGVGMICVKG